MNGREGGGSRSSGTLSVPPAGRRTTTTTTFFPSFLLLLVVPLLFLPLVAAGVPHMLPQRPQYIEAIRPVMPNGPPPPAGVGVMGPVAPPQPMVIQQVPENMAMPRKRAAIVLDKLMFALQKALDDTPNSAAGGQQQQQGGYPRNRAFAAGPMDLQRRGNNDGRLYWRCYFNAVSCF